MQTPFRWRPPRGRGGLSLSALALLAWLVLSSPGAGNREVSLPATPLGRLAEAWVQAINSDDENRMRQFIVDHFSAAGLRSAPETQTLAMFRTVARESHGLDVARVFPGETPLTFLVRTRGQPHWATVIMALSGEEPAKLAGIGVFPTDDPAWDEAELWPAAKLSEPERLRVIERNAARRAALDRFSGVVLVGRGDRVLFQHAWGLADRDFMVPNSLNTRFHLGSMGKMFTSVAIAQLVQAGRLRYPDTLASVLPEYPNHGAAARITIHQLLTHTAGLRGLFDEPGYDRTARYLRSADYFPLFAQKPLLFEPGARWSYSNEGFVVLGAIIERLTGQSYADYVRQHIFLPAGMNETGCYALDEVVPHRAIGYLRDETEDPLGTHARRPNPLFIGAGRGNGCGGEYSTASDLWRFSRALRGHRFLSLALTERITTGKVSMGPDTRYGYGFIDTRIAGISVRGHSGGGGHAGINSDLEMFWDGSYTVIVLGNYDAPAAQALDRKICTFLARQRRLEAGGSGSPSARSGLARALRRIGGAPLYAQRKPIFRFIARLGSLSR